MKVHLVDGTYELFRAFYSAPSSTSPAGEEVGATRGLARSMLNLLSGRDVTHLAIAYDHVIESFRNERFAGYKTGAGIDPNLLSQFGLAEEITMALGIVSWPMIEFEADDALATFAARAAASHEVTQVVICTPDKDLAQCVQGERVVLLDRMRNKVIDEAGVLEKYGVAPASIPDWLALVGDTADGIPGIARWGAKSAASVLAVYQHLESIPEHAHTWKANVRGALALATSLNEARQDALLYRELAQLRIDAPLRETIDDVAWKGPNMPVLRALCERIGDGKLCELAERTQREKGL
jgi:5'-3' exonuclease